MEVKEENINISEENNEDLVIKEEPKIQIEEEINEDPIIKKDLKVKMVVTIDEEIEEKFSRISMKSNHMVFNLKILLFLW